MRAPFHARSAGGRQFTNYTPTFLADAMLGGLHTSEKAEPILLDEIMYELNELRLVYGQKSGNSKAGWYWGLQGQQQTSIQFIVAGLVIL